MKSTLKLFKAMPIKENKARDTPEKILRETIKYGFVFSPEVVYNYPDTELWDIIKTIKKEIGVSAEEINSSFHKSWNKVKYSSIEQLVFEQIIHYFTTYGAELFGVYDEDSVYIPNERLDLPNIDIDGFKFIVIKGYTKEQLKDKVLKLLKSGIALKEDTKADILDVCLFTEITNDEIVNIRNKEVRAMLYDFLDTIPEDPVEFLRYMVYRATESSLLIKSKDIIEQIKMRENIDILALMIRYKNKYGLERLAEIFLRFKPIFLAFKTHSQLNHLINRLRKLSDKYHKPMKEDYLNSITSKIKSGEYITPARLYLALDDVNIFRKIRLAYALKYRTNENADSIMYKIRNGKSFVKDFNFPNKDKAENVLGLVLDVISDDIAKNVKGKKIYYPDNINYTLPATEKQFTGNYPTGSYVSIPKDMVAGIYWKDQNGHRIDLDLSLMSLKMGKVGWDRNYRNSDRSVLFSGDVTAAPNGASELFYVGKNDEDHMLMQLNYYNYHSDIPVPFKIIVAHEKADSMGKNHMVDPNNIVCATKTIIDTKQKVLGLITTSPDETRFYFNETSLGNMITSRVSDVTMKARKYLVEYFKDMINLREVLDNAGAIFVDDPEECDIDLSPENLEKDTIIELLI